MKDFFKNNCEIVRDILPIYDDKAVSTKTFKFVTTHLLLCPDCRNYLKLVKLDKSENVRKKYPTPNPNYTALTKKIRKRRLLLASVATVILLSSISTNIASFLSDDG